MPSIHLVPEHGLMIDFTVARLALTALLCSSIYWAYATWRKASTHPLSRFPGPFTAFLSNFTHCRRFMGGRQPYEILKLHEKYGPVVRTAPNELSFNTAQSWRDIYGPRKGHELFIKSEFYDGLNFATKVPSITTERNPAKHTEMRKYLGGAFSDRSLREQEYLVAEVVDQFIEMLDNSSGEEDGSGKELDLVNAFNLTTFDIIGSLAFGEPFGGVAFGKEHFWVSIAVSSLRKGALADGFKRFPWVSAAVQSLFSGFIKKMLEDKRKHEAYSMELVQRRIQRQTNRKDFMTRILLEREHQDISDAQIAAHARDFIIAGSETTATALSCASYYLLKDPRVLQLLQQEIRSAFKAYSEIDGTSTVPLKYLNAVALEALRIYPPLPVPLPRVVPAGGDTVDGHFLPEGTVVSTNPFAASMDSTNFHEPWEFIPERWLGQSKEDELNASQPFSMGTRGCLGRSLAWMELRTILAKLHFSYDLALLGDGQDVDWHRDSRMYLLWKKPKLMVKATRLRR